MEEQRSAGESVHPMESSADSQIAVALLTGGGDRPYAYGLATELMAKGIGLDLIGSDDLDCPEFHHKPGLRFLNLRGDQRPDASLTRKAARVSRFYAKLIRYAATAKPKIFHILWNNKFLFFDRTGVRDVWETALLIPNGMTLMRASSTAKSCMSSCFIFSV
jgi:hypothetical protein